MKSTWAAGVAILLLLTIACGAGTRTFSDDNSSGTWSIVVVDGDAAEVGVALATCVPDDFKLACGRLEVPASMGPPPFGSGNWAAGRLARTLWLCFNGATAFRQWKPPFPTSLPTVCLNSFNGATAFRQWKQVRDVGHSNHAAELQWGHRLSAVETAFSYLSAYGVLEQLQWGPPPFGSGNRFGMWVTPTTLLCFNGATAFRQWKLGC